MPERAGHRCVCKCHKGLLTHIWPKDCECVDTPENNKERGRG